MTTTEALSDLEARGSLLELDYATPPPVIPRRAAPVSNAQPGSPAAQRSGVSAVVAMIYALGLWARMLVSQYRAATVLGAAPAVSVSMAVAPTAAAVARIVPYTHDKRGRVVRAHRYAVVSPFKPGFPAAIKAAAGAEWDNKGPCVPAGSAGVWHFDSQALPAVRGVLMSFFGTNGGPAAPVLVTAPAPTPLAAPVMAPAPVAAPTPATAVTQPIPFVPAADLAAQRVAALAAAGADVPDNATALTTIDASLAAELAPALAEGAHMAATAHLVRGGVLPSEVNSGAGFNSRAAGERASLATAASASRFGATGAGAAASAATASAIAPEAPIARPALTTGQAAGLAPTLAAGINASRARVRAQAETPAARVAREAAESAKRTRQVIDGAIAIALQSSDGTYPHGCIAAWRPTGEQPWHRVAQAADSAGCYPPPLRSHRAVASDAVRALEGGGLRVQVVTRGREWSVYRPAAVSAVGASVGEARLVAALDGEELTLVGPDDLCAAVRAAWERARQHATVGSTEITAWLVRLLSQWRAVDTCYGRWVPPGDRSERWCALAAALAKAGLPVPAKPAAVSSRADISEEIAAGLAQEVDNLVSRVTSQRDRAVAAGQAAAQTGKERPADLGMRAALSALADIDDARDKITLYEVIVGPMPVVRTALDTLAADLQPLVGATAQRGVMLELD